MIRTLKKYCNSLTQYSRYKTQEVYIGDVPLGGDNPIRIQSMTITNTMNTKATVEQSIRMVDAGCEYVRITAPSINEAKNLENIKKDLRARGYTVPLIADIHFTPKAAEIAARIVEKVRINPGNYADKKKFESMDFLDEAYEKELDRIRNKFTPLVKICKEYGTAMRIGTNHGSLSDRIISRYGDTPLGMVESALEFVRICEDLDYHNIVLSMKASNPQVMVQAYRLLVQKMGEEGMNYPLHLGVTEAGGGEDGRIKSAVGIGTLLEDGLGDTVRVSLTEDPEYEAPVAISLVNRYKGRENHASIKPIDEPPVDPFTYTKRTSIEVNRIGGSQSAVVVADFSNIKNLLPENLKDVGHTYNKETDKWNLSDTAADIIYLGNNRIPENYPGGVKLIQDYQVWIQQNNNSQSYPLLTVEEYLNAEKLSSTLNFLTINLNQFDSTLSDKLCVDTKTVLVVSTDNSHGMAEQRRLFFELIKNDIQNPLIIKRYYNNITQDELRLYASTDFGALLIDGFGDGIWVENVQLLKEDKGKNTYTKVLVRNGESSNKIINRTLFGILQAARVRISKTEYIACPSCGRTLFDLQETTEMIRKRTEHLKGVKIAVMGCIVNGPGEMADADYGYVGSGLDKITLYKEKDIVRRNVPSSEAVDALIKLIKSDEKWCDPPDTSS
jgi:(E)-4-hydroxy-3-methylbut-2-enyl-diphosphate synthase